MVLVDQEDHDLLPCQRERHIRVGENVMIALEALATGLCMTAPAYAVHDYLVDQVGDKVSDEVLHGIAKMYAERYRQVTDG